MRCGKGEGLWGTSKEDVSGDHVLPALRPAACYKELTDAGTLASQLGGDLGKMPGKQQRGSWEEERGRGVVK